MRNPYDLGRSVGASLADILLENDRAPKRIIAIYAGRFQPFHAGHYSVYKLLVSKFGEGNVYIGTSNVTEPGRSPFSFPEKKTIITTMFGISSSKVVQVKNPFAPEEILNHYDPQTTAYVTAFSDKDAGRLGGKYFKPFSGTRPENMKGYEDEGYFIVAPELHGFSGTQVRAELGSKTSSRSQKETAFIRLYGRMDKKIFNLVVDKLGGKLTEHFQGPSMISRVLVEKYKTNQLRYQLLREGGAAGHLAHPFEDHNLTFGDLKQMIDSGLSGKLNVEAPVTEKLDGQNISVSYRPDKGVIFGRNKSHLKDHGLNAMSVSGIKDMFSGRGEISDAFSLAADDLEKAISSLTDKQKEKVFGGGSKFMSMEIIYPSTQNVIPYGLNLLVFHNTIEFDEAGNPVGTDSEAGRMLAGMVKQINQDVQKTFTFRGPVVVTLPRSENFAQQKAKYFGKVNKLQYQFGLSDNDAIMMWHQAWWEQFITQRASQLKYVMPNSVLAGLIRRWAYLDNGAFAIADMRRAIDNDDFLNWVLSFDKTDHKKQARANLEQFEMIFLELGADILQNARGLISLSPGDAAARLRSDLDAAVKELSSTSDINKLGKLKDNLRKIEALGIERLVPTEGIVFLYKGKMYKLTGEFAPLNQILGALKY